MAWNNNFNGTTKLKDWWNLVKGNFAWLKDKVDTLEASGTNSGSGEPGEPGEPGPSGLTINVDTPMFVVNMDQAPTSTAPRTAYKSAQVTVRNSTGDSIPFEMTAPIGSNCVASGSTGSNTMHSITLNMLSDAEGAASCLIYVQNPNATDPDVFGTMIGAATVHFTVVVAPYVVTSSKTSPVQVPADGDGVGYIPPDGVTYITVSRNGIAISPTSVTLSSLNTSGCDASLSQTEKAIILTKVYKFAPGTNNVIQSGYAACAVLVNGVNVGNVALTFEKYSQQTLQVQLKSFSALMDTPLAFQGSDPGVETIVEDIDENEVHLTLRLKGQLSLGSFTWSMQYTSDARPYYMSGEDTITADTNMNTWAAVSPYIDILATEDLTGYSPSTYVIKNHYDAIVEGNPVYNNFFAIGFAKNTGDTITVNDGEYLDLIKIRFRKRNPLQENGDMFWYSVAGMGSYTTKIVQGQTSLTFSGETSDVTAVIPEAFGITYSSETETLPTISVGCSTVLDLVATEDDVYNAYMNQEHKTTLYIKSSYLAKGYIDVQIFDPTAKEITLSDLKAGAYFFSIVRAGYLTRDFDVVVGAEDLDLGDKPLLAGDIFADGKIDGSDSEWLFSLIGYGYGDRLYEPACDLNADGIIDGTDTEMLFNNLGLDVSNYGETVDYYS